MINNVSTGRYGEALACDYLQGHGMIILQKNYRCSFGEVDIIAKDKDYTVAVEVKYRSSTKFGYPREAVGINKQFKIKNTFMHYLKGQNINCLDLRFDVIEILNVGNKIKIEYIKNAFW